jgi:DNA-binding CsgD family transcriptional regulator
MSRRQQEAFPATGEIELRKIWADLRAGRLQIVKAYTTKEAHGLVLERREQSAAAASRVADFDVTEAALAVGVRRIVAERYDMSCASVAVVVHGCLQQIGWNGLPSRLPLLLVFAACAAHYKSEARAWIVTKAGRMDISIARPEGFLRGRLATSEIDVIRLLVEGSSYAEIAQVRGTSIRTVANQVASGFRRIGVNGRGELLTYLYTVAVDALMTPTGRVEPSALDRARRERDHQVDPLLVIAQALSTIQGALSQIHAARSAAGELNARIDKLEATVKLLQGPRSERSFEGSEP